MYSINCDKYANVAELCTAINEKHTIKQFKLAYINDENVGDIASDTYFHHINYRPIWHLLDIIRQTNDIGLFYRVIGLHPIQFIQLKKKLCEEKLLKKSWSSIHQPVFHTDDQKDISFDAKVITVQSIAFLIKQYLKAMGCENMSQGYVITAVSVTVLSTILGWKQPKQSLHNTMRSILIFAIQQVIPNNTPVMVIMPGEDQPVSNNMSKITLTAIKIVSLIPDITLFTRVRTSNKHYFSQQLLDESDLKKFNLRKFLYLQYRPYYNIDGRRLYQDINNDVHSNLLNILQQINCRTQQCSILENGHKIDEYNDDNWRQFVIKKINTLSCQGSDFLSIETVQGDNDLYDALVGIKNANVFLDYMALNNIAFFYNMILQDGLQSPKEQQLVKGDMFIAFVTGNIIELFMQCGIFLTEDVFSVIFHTKVTMRHIHLLQRGVILRKNMNVFINRKQDNKSINIQQGIRIAQKTSLQLLCTYFTGLDKIIPIKESIKVIPNACSYICYSDKIIHKNIDLDVSLGVELREYPLPLVESFIDALSTHSTNMLLLLQEYLCTNRCIGISNAVLEISDIKCDIISLVNNKLDIFQYFTGHESLKRFQQWVDMLIKQPRENDLMYELLSSDEDIHYKHKAIFIVLMLVMSRRDCIIMGKDADYCIEIFIKPVFSDISATYDFDRLYSYAKLLSAPLEHQYLNMRIASTLKQSIQVFYHNVIPSNALPFVINNEYSSSDLDPSAQGILDIHLKNMKSKIDNLPLMRLLNGSPLKLIPWVSGNMVHGCTPSDVQADAVSSELYVLHGYTLSIDEDVCQSSYHLNHTVDTNESIIEITKNSDSITTTPIKVHIMDDSQNDKHNTIVSSSMSINQQHSQLHNNQERVYHPLSWSIEQSTSNNSDICYADTSHMHNNAFSTIDTTQYHRCSSIVLDSDNSLVTDQEINTNTISPKDYTTVNQKIHNLKHKNSDSITTTPIKVHIMDDSQNDKHNTVVSSSMSINQQHSQLHNNQERVHHPLSWSIEQSTSNNSDICYADTSHMHNNAFSTIDTTQYHRCSSIVLDSDNSLVIDQEINTNTISPKDYTTVNSDVSLDSTSIKVHIMDDSQNIKEHTAVYSNKANQLNMQHLDYQAESMPYTNTNALIPLVQQDNPISSIRLEDDTNEDNAFLLKCIEEMQPTEWLSMMVDVQAEIT